MTQLPPFLKKGDLIGIAAPARKVSPEEMAPAIHFLRNEGFEVMESEFLYSDSHQFSGSDEERSTSFQALLDNPDVKAILCARGGYGSVRIIDKLDFTHFCLHPKWICGFSDVTVFHSHIHQNYHIATLHSTLAFNIDKNESIANETLINALLGKETRYTCPSHPLNRCGNATGEIVGGNLSMLYSLLGSSSDINTDGKILFIEDLDEYLYHIDRMMMNLKRNGKLDKLAGLLVGAMSDMHDNTIPFGKTAEEIVAEHCAEYDYPVCFGFPTGHISNNHALVFGQSMTLQVDDTYSNLLGF
ncbi:MAG: LD-carboxypeptidase [Bacteroidales bacterium]|nr:LD-carboxypeptidase [Bacteroidales bacterium]